MERQTTLRDKLVQRSASSEFMLRAYSVRHSAILRDFSCFMDGSASLHVLGIKQPGI